MTLAKDSFASVAYSYWELSNSSQCTFAVQVERSLLFADGAKSEIIRIELNTGNTEHSRSW